MPSNAVTCIGQHSVCAVRATRLGADCTPLTGASNTVVTAGFMTLNLTPDVEAGTRFEPKNGCGKVLWVASEPDVIKRYNIDGEMAVFDVELDELLTDASLIMGKTGGTWATKAIGLSMPGPSTAQGSGVALEIWTKTGSGDGSCGTSAEVPPYTRHVLPHCTLRPNDRAFALDVATFKVTGVAEQNSLWGVGPYGSEADPASVDTLSPYYWIYDTALPVAGCGYTA